MFFWTPIGEDGQPVFARILEPLGSEVWKATIENIEGEALPLRREDVIRDSVLRSSAILSDPIYRRFLALREAHRQVSRPFEFADFEDEMLDRGLNALREARPALNRLLERVLCNAVDAWTDIAHAILRNRQSLAKEGLLQSEAVAVERVTPGASDLHDGGRSATEIRFASGELLYLKPRDGAADIIWNQMLTDVAPSLGIELPTTNVVNFRSHHWSAEIQNSEHEESVEHHYRQLGALTFFVYLFQGIDFHCENVIATNGGPTVVDLEGLLHPTELPGKGWDDATTGAFHRLVTSVVNTGLLPCFIGGDGQAASVGAMNPPIESRSERLVPSGPRTSEMKLELREYVDFWTQHTPVLKRQIFDDDWIRSALSGFQTAYRVCQAGGCERAITSAIESLRDAELRFILRPTPHYYNALHKLLSATYDGREVDERSLLSGFMKSLPTAFGVGDRLVESEVDALSQFDIPRFTRLGGSFSIEASGAGSIRLDLPESPIDQSVMRYRELCTFDLEIQTNLLDASFGGLRADSQLTFASREHPNRSDLLNLAVECGRTILASSIGDSREIAWLVASPVGNRGRTNFEVCGVDLYAGLSGIALFLGELYEATQESSFKQGAIRCVETIRRRLEEEYPRLGIGGGTGVGGILYAMSCLDLTVPESSAAGIASWICHELSMEQISVDQRFDVMDGAAGLLLGLIAHRGTECHEELEEACADVLLAGLSEARRLGLRSWQTFESDEYHTGMAHGSSGIAMALARRYAASPNSSVLRAIEIALGFDLEVGFGSIPAPIQWCHGAPGISLAHSDIAVSIPAQAERLQSPINEARLRTRWGADNTTDGVCCGSMGRAAALFHTMPTGTTDDRMWLPVVAAVSEGRRQNATYRWSAGDDKLNPGLFVGVSGIGLELLFMGQNEIARSPLTFR